MWDSYTVVVMTLHELAPLKRLPKFPPFDWMVCSLEYRSPVNNFDCGSRTPYCVVRQLFYDQTGLDSGETADDFARLCMQKGEQMPLPWNREGVGAVECANDELILLEAGAREDEIYMYPTEDEIYRSSWKSRTHPLISFRQCGSRNLEEEPQWWFRAHPSEEFQWQNSLEEIRIQYTHQQRAHRAWWLWFHTTPRPQRNGAVLLPLPPPQPVRIATSQAAFMQAGYERLKHFNTLMADQADSPE